MEISTSRIKKYWETRPPGLRYSDNEYGTKAFFEDIEKQRYGSRFHYSYLVEHAEFDSHIGEAVLEIGMGLGTDILQFAKNGSRVTGVDLTENSVETVRKRFDLYGLSGRFQQADFRELPFDSDSFDLVYSFGVLHHSPYMNEGVDEVFRVLKPGGKAIIMLYHKGFKYYIRKLFYRGVLKGEYLRRSTQEIINNNTEEFGQSPCTFVISRKEAEGIFAKFSAIEMRGFRMDDDVHILGRRFSPTLMTPRWLSDRLENRFGWNLLIKATK